jgi:hypothetical protein
MISIKDLWAEGYYKQDKSPLAKRHQPDLQKALRLIEPLATALGLNPTRVYFMRPMKKGVAVYIHGSTPDTICLLERYS